MLHNVCAVVAFEEDLDVDIVSDLDLVIAVTAFEDDAGDVLEGLVTTGKGQADVLAVRDRAGTKALDQIGLVADFLCEVAALDAVTCIDDQNRVGCVLDSATAVDQNISFTTLDTGFTQTQNFRQLDEAEVEAVADRDPHEQDLDGRRRADRDGHPARTAGFSAEADRNAAPGDAEATDRDIGRTREAEVEAFTHIVRGEEHADREATNKAEAARTQNQLAREGKVEETVVVEEAAGRQGRDAEEVDPCGEVDAP